MQLDDVLALSALALEAADRSLIADADAGAADAQCDLALLLLSQGQAVEAVAWLRRAAQALYPEALHWLGRCAIAGVGMTAAEAEGIELIAQAARRGHGTAGQLLAYLEDPARPELHGEALEAALDAIERELVSKALREHGRAG